MDTLTTIENNKCKKAQLSKLNNEILKRIWPHNNDYLNSDKECFVCMCARVCVLACVCVCVITISDLKVIIKTALKTNTVCKCILIASK